MILCMMISWGQTSSSTIASSSSKYVIICNDSIEAPSDPIDVRYNCIHEWDPCDMNWWQTQSFWYPMYPEKYGVPLFNVVPGTEIKLFREICQETSAGSGKYQLATGWHVYHRQLFDNDIPIVIPTIYKQVEIMLGVRQHNEITLLI